ncbi:MAG: hypothetical protein ACRC8S_08985 [Fimbriiglobus sp.]
MLLPKYGRRAGWHRWLGRFYATLIALASLLGTILAYQRDNSYLMLLGTITLALVVAGWREAMVARNATRASDRTSAHRHLRRHLILMGASYIGAWSGFFATNPILGTGELQLWSYVFGPSILGAIVISRVVRKV